MQRFLLIAAVCSLGACSIPSSAVPRNQASRADADLRPNTVTREMRRLRNAPPLSAYIGKYPFDRVNGVAFVNHPRVRAMISGSGAPQEALAYIRNRDGVVSPILEVDGRLWSRGFEAASGGDNNWGVLISADGSSGAVCYAFSSESQNISGAEWFIARRKAFTPNEMCPSEAQDLRSFDAISLDGPDTLPRLRGSYWNARRRLLSEGYSPVNVVTEGWRVCVSEMEEEREISGTCPSRYDVLPEVQDCAGTGLGQCRAIWRSPNGRNLTIITVGEPQPGFISSVSWSTGSEQLYEGQD